MRDAKAKKVKYHWTQEQLNAHDELLMNAWKEKANAEFERRTLEVHKIAIESVKDKWDEYNAEFYTGERADDFFSMLQYVLSVSARVLIEKFGWASVKGHESDMRFKINQFSDYMIEEINALASDDMNDIKGYSAEVERMYGVKYNREVVD